MPQQDTKILIVEEMIGVRKLIVRLFESLGYRNLIMASNYAQAWAALSSAEPPIELIFSTHEASQGSGLEFFKRVRKSIKLCNTTFVMMTLETSASVFESAGVNACLTKPISLEALKNTLNRIEEMSKSR